MRYDTIQNTIPSARLPSLREANAAPIRLLELAKLQHTILISPDHRLLPESNGLDVLEDLASFWSWYSEKLEPTLASLYPELNVRPDFDRLFVHGGSAGGYLAAQSMLLHPEIKPKAVNMAYPMTDLRDDWWCKEFEKPVFGMPSNVSFGMINLDNYLMIEERN